ncbi:MAG TPA: phosphatase PAP2 family protein [Verrucomicrobiae bacterium]|jgi:membrane-associated phospholipid phosphatase
MPTFAGMAYFETSTPAPRGKILAWLVAGAVVVALLWPLDSRVDAALDVTKNPAWNKIAWWCSKLGEGWVIIVAGLVLSFLCLAGNRSRAAAHIFYAGTTSMLLGILVVILRGLAGRTRPLAPVPQGFYGVWHDGHWIIGKFIYSSFPSGHTVTAVGLATAIWLVHRGWGAVVTVYALAVAWSRIALQCHHLSDVLTSTVIGIVGAMFLKPILLPSIEFQFGNLHRAWKK